MFDNGDLDRGPIEPRTGEVVTLLVLIASMIALAVVVAKCSGAG